MTQDIKICVDARLNFFSQYMTVPQTVSAEHENFCERITALGESCSTTAEFEQRFVSEGLSDEFNGLIAKCTPKAFEMTAEQKQASKQMAKEMIIGDKKQFAKEVAREVLDDVRVQAESQMITASREKKIADGTFRDFTVQSNRAEDAGRLFGFLKKKIKK